MALVISEILKLFVKTFTADHNYSRRNIQNFRQQVQTPLSQKEEPFCGFFIEFLKFAWNIEHFEEKGEYPNLSISEIIESERGSYLNL